MVLLMIILTLLVSIATSVFILKRYIDGYWERRGLYTYRPKDKNENIVLETYKTLKAKGLKHGANVKFYKPSFVTIDLDVAKAILIKDADHFMSRGMYCDPKLDPASASILRLENTDWKRVRSVVSPIFSSGKLKMIFPDLAAHAKILQEILVKNAESNEPFEMKDLAKRFGMDAMGSCTFGFEINTLCGKNKEFQDLVRNLVAVTWRRIAEFIINRNILKFFRLRSSNPEVRNYVKQLILETIDFRDRNNIKRNDIFEYVKQITDENIDDTEMVKNGKLSKAQMLISLTTFFAGGFETSSTVVSFAVLELALNQSIQDKLRKDINESLKRHGEMTYDSIMELEYLDWVVNETLRKYPPAQEVSRMCTKAYRIPNSDILIQPNEFITIPAMGIQMDPDYYLEPEKFDPERFSPEKKMERHPMTFLPFGDGPRNCVGARLGQIITKVAVAALISKFKITLNEKTIIPIRFKKRSLMLEVEGGVWLNCSIAN